MRLEDILAAPHPDGHRIDLRWANPDPSGFPGVRVLRREGTHPKAPDDGVVVADGTALAIGTDARGRALFRVVDPGLKGQTVYYYTIFPFSGSPPVFDIDRENRATALSTSSHGMADQMYALLPAIYRRYDAEQNQLRRFLALPGGQLDLLQSLARSVLDSLDIERVDGRLLALLAEWIGWKTNFQLDLDGQRNEIRQAPAIYRRVGLLPVVGATVKRITGWESRAKEFVHNVLCTNRPPRLNLRARVVAADGSLVIPDSLLSLDSATDGRPTAAVDDHRVRWLFCHTLRQGRWRIAYKTSPTLRLRADALALLRAPDLLGLQQAFAAAGVALAADAIVSAAGRLWHVDDATNAQRYVVEEGDAGLTVYHVTAAPLASAALSALPAPSLAPSRLLTQDAGVDEKYPAAALQNETLWVFWSSYDRAAARWELRYRIRRDGEWSETRRRLWEVETDPIPERRLPAVLVDNLGGLWLFWLERAGERWALRYNRHDGTGLDVDPTTGWELDPPADFPPDGSDDPRVEGDLFALFHPNDLARRIWIFWARKVPTSDAEQTRWAVAYRVKSDVDPSDATDWGVVEQLPKAGPLDHDREPAVYVDGDDNLALFWSASRDGSWSIWRATLDLAAGPAPVWNTATAVTAPPYSQRDPLPLPLNGDVLLIYRSNESLSYVSDVYRATATKDFRYAGATTVTARNAPALGLRGDFEDFQGYTLDVGTGNADWYRRDTLGVYVLPDIVDPDEVNRRLARIAAVLPEFMPATDRAVYVVEP